MTIKTTVLCELTSAHGFLGGARCEALVFAPTPETAVLLDRQRMFFRRTAGGCVVLVEVDPRAAALEPIVPIAPELRLDFTVTSRDAALLTYSALPDSGARAHVLSNRRASTDVSGARLHPDAALGADTAGVISGAHLGVDIPAAVSEAGLDVVDEGGVVLAARRVSVVAGRAAANFDLTAFAPRPVVVRMDGAPVLRAFVDPALTGTTPLAVASLTAAVASPELSLVDAAGQPRGTRFRLVLHARSTIWRYTVVTRTQTALNESSLAIEDHPTDAATPPLAFAPIGPKAPIASGEQAVIFESATPVPLLARPRAGLRLARVVAPGTVAPLLHDLPNPPPSSLSPASLPGRPVSEVFLYV